MAYRSDLEALEARHAALEAEVAERTRQRDEIARMVDEARSREHHANIARDWAAGGPARRRRRNINIGVAVGVVMVLGLGVVRLATRPSARERRIETAIKKFEYFTDQICACKDKTCAERVTADITKWSEEMTRSYKDDWAKDPPDYDATKRMEKIATRFSECMTKVYQLETPAERPADY
jgi:hypothetical protein